jgi:hypothetical protein
LPRENKGKPLDQVRPALTAQLFARKCFAQSTGSFTGAIEPGIDVHQDFYVVVVQEGGAVQHPSISASGGNYRLANSYRN